MSSNQLQAGGFREPLASRSVNDLHRINPVDISIRKMERALTDNDWIISRPDANRVSHCHSLSLGTGNPVFERIDREPLTNQPRLLFACLVLPFQNLIGAC
jgi:hypothetical protein